MKKAVISLLVLLPLVLVVVIAVAGRIYGSQEYVEVTEVYFVNETGDEIDSLTVKVGEEKQLECVLLPKLATNKNVTYSSNNESVCTVSSRGLLAGVSIGRAEVTVKTLNEVSATIVVTVESAGATKVYLSNTSLVAYVGCSIDISALAEPTEETKNITWTSLNEDVVKIDGAKKGRNVTLSFLKEGTATVMAKTENGLTASCEVIVKSGGARFKNESENVNIKSINLVDYIEGDAQGVTFELMSGDGEISGKNLSYTGSGNGICRVKLKNADGINYDEIVFLFRLN